MNFERTESGPCPSHKKDSSTRPGLVTFHFNDPLMTANQQKQSRVTAALLGAIVVLLLGACERNNAPDSTSKKPDAPGKTVHATRVHLAPVERIVKSFGSLSAHEQATLSTKVPGRLENLLVDLGAVLRKDDVIAQLDQKDYKLRLQQAEALLAQARVRLGLPLQGEDDSIAPEDTSQARQAKAVLDEARTTRERIRNLSEQKIISKSEVETAEAAYIVALGKHQATVEEARTQQALVAQRRAEVRIARQALEDTTITAPFDGAVQERRANIGEYLSASSPIITLVRMDPLRLRLEVAEAEAPRIAVGQKVRLTLQGTTNIYSGEIKRLSPALDERSRMLRIEADVPNPGPLRPGSFVTAEIVINPKDMAVTVPSRALVTFAGIEKIFVFESGKAIERSVTTGQRFGQTIEIISGISAGDVVILEPGAVQNGASVTASVGESSGAPASSLNKITSKPNG